MTRASATTTTRRRGAGVAIGLALAALAAGCAAQTDPATVSGPTAARLNAHGQTDTSAAHYEFQYATEAGLLGTADGFATPTRGPIPPHTPNLPFSERVTALRPGTTYSYRVCGGDARVVPDVCDGTRTFTTPSGTPVVDFAPTELYEEPGISLGQLAAGDFDRDGNLDVATLGGVPAGPRGPVLVLRGDGRGGFAAPFSVAPGAGLSGATALAAADFDNDGRTDLAIGSQTAATGAPVVEVLKGDGSGGFTPLPPVSLPVAADQLTAADLDRDGKRDLVVVGGGEVGNGQLQVLRGDGHGGFAVLGAVDTGEPAGLAAARDMNHDGILDLIVFVGGALSLQQDAVTVVLGDGKGGFGPPDTTPLPDLGRGPPAPPAIADFDRDGNPDVATGTGQLLLGTGTGALRAPSALVNFFNRIALARDVNLDGRADIVGGMQPGVHGQVGSRMRVEPGNGDGSFQTPNDFPCAASCPTGGGSELQDAVAGDFTHSGRPSIVASFLVTVAGGDVKSLLTLERNTTGLGAGAATASAR